MHIGDLLPSYSIKSYKGFLSIPLVIKPEPRPPMKAPMKPPATIPIGPTSAPTSAPSAAPPVAPPIPAAVYTTALSKSPAFSYAES